MSRKNRITNQGASSSVEENRRKIEKQLNQASRNSSRPTPNAVAIGFEPSSRQPNRNFPLAESGSDLENVSEIAEEGNNKGRS